MYLVSSGVSSPCGLLPINLDKCPTCSCGIKPSRGWTWIDPVALTADRKCQAPVNLCHYCSLRQLSGKHGLLWIGGAYYEKPEDWTKEAIEQGVSRRISAIPKGFELHKTWVFVAHRDVSRKPCLICDGNGFDLDRYILDGSKADCEACNGEKTIPQAAIFHAFKPSAIEYVVKGDETTEELDAMIKRGITPVHIEHKGETSALDFVEDQTEIEEVAK